MTLNVLFAMPLCGKVFSRVVMLGWVEAKLVLVRESCDCRTGSRHNCVACCEQYKTYCDQFK